MTKRPILLHPDPRLKKPCAPIASIDADMRALADDMLETMYLAPGIGLAAPQVGVLSQMLVMDCAAREDDTTQAKDPRILINPKVTWESEETGVYEEGCLSIPEFYADVVRPKMVRVAFTDIDGKAQEEEFDDLWATCVQHEIDHLNGRLFIDYLTPLKRTMITNKMKKFKKEQARRDT